MASKPVVILGGGGSGVIVAQGIIDIAAAGGDLHALGFLNDVVPQGSLIEGLPVLGKFENWRAFPDETLFITAVHKPKEMLARARRISALEIPQSRLAVVLHPSALVAARVPIGPGSYIGPNAVIMPGARIGAHASLRAGCYVSHDVTVEDLALIGPNATISGRTQVGEGAHIGPNAGVREDLSIGRFAVVGIGAVVVRDVPDLAIVIGNPAREVGKVGDGRE